MAGYKTVNLEQGMPTADRAIRRLTYAVSAPPERPLRHAQLRDPVGSGVKRVTVLASDQMLDLGKDDRRVAYADVAKAVVQVEFGRAAAGDGDISFKAF